MKKAIKFLFVAALIVLMLVSVVACGGGASGNNGDNPGGEGGATPTPDGNGSTVYANFTKPGEVYSFTSWQYSSDNPYDGDDERSQQMRDRVQAMQEKYGITIQFIPNGTISSNVILQSAFQGAPEITGMKEGGLHTMMTTYLYMNLTGKCLVALSDHQDVYNFNNEAKFNTYSQYDLCEYNNKLWFFIPVEIGVHFETAGNCMVFNKNLLKAVGYEDTQIYEWVEKGEWDWAKFEEVLSATTDLTRNQWGIERGNQALVMWSLANGNGTEFVANETLASGQKNDTFVYSGDKGDRLMEAYDEFIKLANTLKVMETTYYGSTDTEPLKHFLNGNVAFFYNGYSSNPLVANNSYNEITISSASFDYGLIPWPKGTTAAAKGENYSSMYPHLNPYCVFRNDTGNEKGAVQVLCELYTPVYDADSQEAKDLYESEKAKACRDEQSMKWLDYVEENKTHFRVFMYSNAPVSIGDATNVSGALFGKGEDAILREETGAKAYFTGIANAINQAIHQRSPYSWK